MKTMLSARTASALILSTILVGPALAQLPNLSGGLSGALGSALPNVASVGAGNAAGVLGYCLKNKFLGGGNNAASVLGRLTGKSDVTSSPGYTSGQKGLLQMDGSSLSLDSLKGKAKTKVCDLVLNHAQSFL